MDHLIFSTVDTFTGKFRNQGRATYIKKILGRQYYTFSKTALKAAVDGQKHNDEPDEEEFRDLAIRLINGNANLKQLGRNNRLTNMMRGIVNERDATMKRQAEELEVEKKAHKKKRAKKEKTVEQQIVITPVTPSVLFKGG